MFGNLSRRQLKIVTELKMGFYYIALNSNVTIIPIAFNFVIKKVNIRKSFFVNREANLFTKILNSHFKKA